MPKLRSSTASSHYSDTGSSVHDALESLRHAQQQHDKAILMLKRQQQRHANEQRRAQEEARIAEALMLDDTISNLSSSDALARTLNFLECPTPQFSTKPVTQSQLELLNTDLGQVLDNVAQLEQVVDRLRQQCSEEQQNKALLLEQLASVQSDRDELVEQMASLVANAEKSAGVIERELAALEAQAATLREQNSFLTIRVQQQQQQQQQQPPQPAQPQKQQISGQGNSGSPSPPPSSSSLRSTKDFASALSPPSLEGSAASRYTVKTRY